MTLTERFSRIERLKFSFSKSTEFSGRFAGDSGAFSMFDAGYGLGIPTYLSLENQLRAVFLQVQAADGIFLFNLSGVDMKKARKGFRNFEEAEYNNQITEWELFVILNDRNYFRNCYFHNGKVQFKKRIIWNSIV